MKQKPRVKKVSFGTANDKNVIEVTLPIDKDQNLKNFYKKEQKNLKKKESLEKRKIKSKNDVYKLRNDL